MDKIGKALQKLSAKERDWVKQILRQLSTNSLAGLNIKKLKGRDDIFRVRKGDIRIIYRMANNAILILAIERKNESKYQF